ncbi:Fc.00g001120.m01.CDS01 [Cosmosporella sp. VM-42]
MSSKPTSGDSENAHGTRSQHSETLNDDDVEMVNASDPTPGSTLAPELPPRDIYQGRTSSLLDEGSHSLGFLTEPKTGDMGISKLSYREQEECDVEQELRVELQLSLEQKTAELKALQERRETDLKEKSRDVEEMRKKWKKTAVELNKLRRSGQGFYQVTDRELIDLIGRLRHDIRNFTIQHFGEHLPKRWTLDLTKYHNRYLKRTTPDPKDYVRYLGEERTCPKIIQAFVWRVLVGEVFDQFHWMGDRAYYVWKLRRLLRPMNYENLELSPRERPDPEEERKFQMWSATTTGLILDVPTNTEETDAEFQNRKYEIVENIKDTIYKFKSVGSQGFTDQLEAIVDAACSLDKEISRQVARVIWVFGDASALDVFDPTTMELETGDPKPKEGQLVRFAVAPAVIKRGKSTGEDFKFENDLMKMVVSCEYY